VVATDADADADAGAEETGAAAPGVLAPDDDAEETDAAAPGVLAPGDDELPPQPVTVNSPTSPSSGARQAVRVVIAPDAPRWS
jgi:hypothetical protein